MPDLGKLLLIYGRPATGKSSVELNLRALVFSSPFSHDYFQYNARYCFMGRTARADGSAMSTGGAESLTEDALRSIPAVCEWYIAALPSRGRAGAQLLHSMLHRFKFIQAVCMHTDDAAPYLMQRKSFFTGTPYTGKRHVRARIVRPPLAHASVLFRTEALSEAVEYCADLLELPVPIKIFTLEGAARHYLGNVHGTAHSVRTMEAVDADRARS